MTGGLLMLISPAIVHFAPLTDTAADYLQYMLLFCGLYLMAQSVNTTVLDGIFCAGSFSQNAARKPSGTEKHHIAPIFPCISNFASPRSG